MPRLFSVDAVFLWAELDPQIFSRSMAPGSVRMARGVSSGVGFVQTT